MLLPTFMYACIPPYFRMPRWILPNTSLPSAFTIGQPSTHIALHSASDELTIHFLPNLSKSAVESLTSPSIPPTHRPPTSTPTPTYDNIAPRPIPSVWQLTKTARLKCKSPAQRGVRPPQRQHQPSLAQPTICLDKIPFWSQASPFTFENTLPPPRSQREGIHLA